jgi:hypothetical protein
MDQRWVSGISEWVDPKFELLNHDMITQNTDSLRQRRKIYIRHVRVIHFRAFTRPRCGVRIVMMEEFARCASRRGDHDRDPKAV